MSSKVSVFGAKAPPRFIKIDLKPQGGATMTAEQEQLLKSFMLQSVHLDVSLNEFSSHGSLTFIFKNPVATPVEMLFAFPLMDGGAVITGITTEWDGHRITGRVRESEQGKKEYSEAIANGHTASLVQHAENDLFMWRVGGIPGGCTVTVVTQFCGPVVMTKRFGKKPRTEITLTVPAVVPPWYGKADVGDAALAFNTAVQAPASIGGLALALPPFTATVRSHFITQSLRAVTVSSPTHGPPDASSVRTSHDGLEVSFRDLFKAPAGGKAATNLQMRWVADGIVPNVACLGRMLAGAGQLTAASFGTDSAVSQDAAAVEAMEAAVAALATGPLAADARALLDKTKTQQRQVEQVCGVLFSEHNGKQPEGIHVTVLVDCSGSMYPNRIDKARKAVRALLTSLHPSSTFAVYLFGNRCEPVLKGQQVVHDATPENVDAIADKVDSDTLRGMGGTELFSAVQRVLSGPHVPVARRHNVMILTDGEVGQDESGRVKQMLARVCPGQALVGIIGVGNEVTRTTLRTIVEGGLGPQAIMFDGESDESIANIVLGSVNALVSSQLRNINWPGGKLVGSQPHVQCNSSEVCAAWALYPEARFAPAAAAQDDEWEVVNADVPASSATGACSNGAVVRWLGGTSVSVAAARESDSAVQLPTLLVTDEHAVKSMCIAAALARCRHASCKRQEATKLALRYGFVCAEADSVMVAISDRPVADPSIALSCFGVAIPSQPANPVSLPNFGSRFCAPQTLSFAAPIARGFSVQSFGAAQPHYAPPPAQIFASLPVAQRMCRIPDGGSFGPKPPSPPMEFMQRGFRGTAPTVDQQVDSKQVVRKTNVVVVLDLSSSMSYEAFGRLAPAKAAIMQLWDVLLVGDSLTIITFNTEVTTVMPRRFKWEPKEGKTKRPNHFVRTDLEAVLSRLQAGGGTALYHALLQAMEQIKAAAKGDLIKAEAKEREAVHTFQLFVITDGPDTDSARISPSSTARAVNELLEKPGGWASQAKFSSCFVGIGDEAQAALAPCTNGLNPRNHFTVDNITEGFRRLTDQIAVVRVAHTQTFKKSWFSVGGGGAAANAVGGSSLLDVLGALHGACWSMRHPAVAMFLAKQLPQAAGMCKSDAHVTVAVIVVLRARFKDSKNGWLSHVKRAAQHARTALGDLEYASHKAALASAMSE